MCWVNFGVHDAGWRLLSEKYGYCPSQHLDRSSFCQEMEQNGEIKIKDEVKEELFGESWQGRRDTIWYDTMIAFFPPDITNIIVYF